ncbi:class I SAM-dependent methyltransferase [bacterium]|nr:class I SAM-dependent methyltransferase [bacterium]
MDDENFDLKTAEDWIKIIEHPKSQVRIQDIYPKLQSWAEHSNTRTILEVGCGQGVCSSALDLTDKKYTGIDASSFLIERAKKLYATENTRFVIGNAYSLPLEDGCMDGVFSVALWHLLSDIKKASKEFARVLKPNGHFLIIAANSEAFEAWQSPQDTLYLRSQEELTAALDFASLRIDKVETFRELPKGLKMYILIQGYKP